MQNKNLFYSEFQIAFIAVLLYREKQKSFLEICRTKTVTDNRKKDSRRNLKKIQNSDSKKL